MGVLFCVIFLFSTQTFSLSPKGALVGCLYYVLSQLCSLINALFKLCADVSFKRNFLPQCSQIILF